MQYPHIMRIRVIGMNNFSEGPRMSKALHLECGPKVTAADVQKYADVEL